jgi:cobalamin biosynthesis Co2+ chelatase CbiK
MKKKSLLNSVLRIVIPMAIIVLMCYCQSKSEEETTVDPMANKKIGVLMVNHGSRSETWRNALLALETSVKDSILKGGIVKGTKTAHMEYTEPSIATRLKEFDKEGYTDIIIIPIFLTVSPHSFDDIPTIIGQKENPESMEALKLEKIERYTPKAKTYLTPLLDFTDMLEKNVLRRFKDISKDATKEGLVMMAYGDETYVKEWSGLLTKVGKYVSQNTGMTDFSVGWCGHIAHYNPDSTTVAINRVLKKKEMAVVVPVLVAHDEMFQVKIIGDGIGKIKNDKEKVIYKPDAILPDPNVEKWVISAAADQVNKIISEGKPAL